MNIFELIRVVGHLLAHDGVNDEPPEVALALVTILAVAYVLVIVIGDRQGAKGKADSEGKKTDLSAKDTSTDKTDDDRLS
jgi:hypothetical protein